jgi:hypothetical protein
MLGALPADEELVQVL